MVGNQLSSTLLLQRKEKKSISSLQIKYILNKKKLCAANNQFVVPFLEKENYEAPKFYLISKLNGVDPK